MPVAGLVAKVGFGTQIGPNGIRSESLQLGPFEGRESTRWGTCRGEIYPEDVTFGPPSKMQSLW